MQTPQSTEWLLDRLWRRDVEDRLKINLADTVSPGKSPLR